MLRRGSPLFLFKLFRLTAALIAVVGQSAVVSATLSLSRDEASAVAHVESNGVSLHHGHDEATCVACRVLSFHGKVLATAHPPAIFFASAVGTARNDAGRVEPPTLLTNLSRAPPVTA